MRKGSLVLLRHARTAWSATGRFTGWEDPPLDDLGEAEARRAGELVAASGFQVAAVLTSCARRAARTAELVLEVAGAGRVPVTADWRLNERHLGQLQGLDRATAQERFGKALVRSCARERDTLPPEIRPSDRRHPVHDPRYRHVDPTLLPGGESLAQLERRVLECWRELAEPIRRAGLDLLVVSHCHALRTLVGHLGAGPLAEAPFCVTGSGFLYACGAAPRALDDRAARPAVPAAAGRCAPDPLIIDRLAPAHARAAPTRGRANPRSDAGTRDHGPG